MKKTRNIFVLAGSEQDVQTAMNDIQFKAVTVFSESIVSTQSIFEVFSNNKSVVCRELQDYDKDFIRIDVINDKHKPHTDCCINIALGDIAAQFQQIANQFNCDIGDHKSNSSGSTDAPNVTDCAYCRYLKHKSDLPQRTIYSSDNFFVLPTLGEFMLGYLLIIPYGHVMSVAELNPRIQKELLEVIEDITYLLNLTYGSSDVLVWENGTGNSGKGKAKDSVVHAHTHIAPSSLTAEKIEEMSGFHFEKISTEELSKYNLHSYLLVKDAENTWRISNDPNVYIPRQYVRQLLADEYGIPGEQWNWREYPFKDKMMQTYYDMAMTTRKNWDTLPARIKENTREHVYKRSTLK